MEEHRDNINPSHRIINRLILCAVGIIVNFLGNLLVNRLGMSIYLDTLGTVFTAAVGGYLPGISVGMCSNLLTSLNDVSQMYYGFISMVMAMLTAFFVRMGVFEKIYKVILSIPLYAAAAGIPSALVFWLLGETDTLDIIGSIGTELLDKSITVGIVFIALKLLPDGFSDKFGGYDESHGADGGREKNVRVISIRTKLVLMLTFACVCTAGTLTAITFYHFRQTEVDDYVAVGNMLTSFMAADIDPDNVETYIKEGFSNEEYSRIYDRFETYMNNYDDVTFIYVYRFRDEGVEVIFDVDTPELEGDPPGYIYDYEEAFVPLKSKLMAGEEIDPIISEDQYGYLLTIYKPVYDSGGNFACYVCADFSMNMIGIYNRVFIVKIITMFIGFLILIYAVSIHVMEKNIISPVNRMAYCTRKFAYNSEAERKFNVDSIKQLEIRTGDEVENLYLALVKAAEDSMQSVKDLHKAETQVHTMEEQVTRMSETAYRDALTGVKNKAAYNKEKDILRNRISDGNAEFAVVMIDLNDLKKVNDNFGHEHGDEYIRGACSIICNIYKHSPVFRIGGDEFVIFLTGSAYNDRDMLYDLVTKLFFRLGNDSSLDPWERFSAAAGMALYDPGKDSSVDEVFNRADEMMYKNKTAMKKNRT